MSEEQQVEVEVEEPAGAYGTEEAVSTRTLLVNRTGGEPFVIEIPKKWRVTFAAVNPAATQGYREGHCLRVYAGSKLVAVYSNVTEFRDLAIPYARKVSSETGNAEWKRDSNGTFTEKRSVSVETAFLPEDTETPF
jgi:hypothetical protein